MSHVKTSYGEENGLQHDVTDWSEHCPEFAEEAQKIGDTLKPIQVALDRLGIVFYPYPFPTYCGMMYDALMQTTEDDEVKPFPHQYHQYKGYGKVNNIDPEFRTFATMAYGGLSPIDWKRRIHINHAVPEYMMQPIRHVVVTSCPPGWKVLPWTDIKKTLILEREEEDDEETC